MSDPTSPTMDRDEGLAAPDAFPCSGCGYDLRGLQVGGRCPECGRPIERSGETLIALLRWRNSVLRAPDVLLVGAAACASAYLFLCGLFLSMEAAVLVAAPLITFGLTDAVATSFASLGFSLAPPGRRVSPLAPVATIVFLAMLIAPLGFCLAAAQPELALIPACARALLPTVLAISIERTNRLVGHPIPWIQRLALLSTAPLASLAMVAAILAMPSAGSWRGGIVIVLAAGAMDLVSRVAATVAARPIRHRLAAVDHPRALRRPSG